MAEFPPLFSVSRLQEFEMNNNDFTKLGSELKNALTDFDDNSVVEICGRIIDFINTSTSAIELSQIKSILYQLRRKRKFSLLNSVAEAVMNSGETHPQVKRQYIQGLIGQGFLAAADSLTNELLADPELSKTERLEAIGLKGRIYKQRFVSVEDKNSNLRNEYISIATEQYLSGYALDSENYWHMINAVALIKRAQREGFATDNYPDPDALTQKTQTILKTLEEESNEPPKAWEIATKLEAEIALSKIQDAIASTLRYVDGPETDAFEIGSTLRQLEEIWELNDREEPGLSILPMMRSALLQREGGALSFNPQKAAEEKINLEGIFGDNPSKTIKWYKDGLDRTASIARIELPDGKGIGTAGVVDGKEFFPDFEGLLLLTNAHVVSENPEDTGLPPDQVRANIQGLGKVFEIDKLIWSSPQRELDATFLSLKEVPDAQPLPLSSSPLKMSSPPPRVYVIGHPNGRDLELSLNDNRMVAGNETFLHYRTPTEPGSSGSPVFEQYGWQMIALHHGGSDQLPRLDGTPGTYQANEGISIEAIKRAIQSS